MAYNPTIWDNSDIPAISADNLNHIETGIKEAHDSIDELNNLTICSTEEYFTGKYWFDGRKIYGKMFDFGALPNNTTKSVPHGITNLDFVTYMHGTSYSEDTGNYFPLPYPADSLNAQVKMWVNDNLNLQTTSDRSSYTKTIITIEYVKTTDEEES